MANIPVVGFVSLGCPKALVDTERIVTELRARGYRIGNSYRDADLVIVNTCGFVNEAVAESLEAISEALAENGRVIVCGCLGGRHEADGSNFVMNRMPKGSAWSKRICPGRTSPGVSSSRRPAFA